MTSRESFVNEVADSYHHPVTTLVFADWLEEHGRIDAGLMIAETPASKQGASFSSMPQQGKL